MEFFSKSTLEIFGSTPQSQNELVFWDNGAHLRVVFKIERLTYMLRTMSDQRGVKLPFVEIFQCFVTSHILPLKYLSTVVSYSSAETAKKQCSLYTLQLCFMAKTAGFIIWAILTTIFRRIIVAISVLVCAKQYQTQPVQWLCYWYGWGPTSETDRFPQKL